MTHPYASQQYAESFGDSFTPMYINSADTWILKRSIPGTHYYDAIGCYPLCIMSPTTNLTDCFATLQSEGLVSLMLVTDIFYSPPETIPKAVRELGSFPEGKRTECTQTYMSTRNPEGEASQFLKCEGYTLQQHFEHCIPYKTRYLYDFASSQQSYSKHHRYEVKQAHTLCEVRTITLTDYLPTWINLYQQLVNRHHITGIQNFSEQYFVKLAQMEGVVTTGAFYQDELLSAHIWIEYEGHVYSHLAASSDEGYARNSAYAVYDYAIRYFRERNARIMDLGGGAGIHQASDGLSFFKKGFANNTGQNFLCGKVLDKVRYEELCKGKQKEGFFPAYR